MCIGGAFGKDLEKQHAAVVMLAIDMLEVIKTCKSPLGEAIHMRIGIHTGPAYGGVIGRKQDEPLTKQEDKINHVLLI